MSKLKEDQLKTLQDLVGKLNSAKMELGQVELQKHGYLHQVSEIQKDLQEFQSKLEEEYGSVNIDIATGELSEVEKQE